MKSSQRVWRGLAVPLVPSLRFGLDAASRPNTAPPAKEVVGKITGNAKLAGEGKAEKAAGKVRNAVGGMQHAARG